MNALTPEAKLHRENLSNEHYFLSLLNEAFAVGMIDDAELSRIQAEAVERFAEKARSYTHGESSSVRSEVAEELMASVIYTVGVYLRTLPTPEDAVTALKQESFRDLYMLGRKKIGVKLATVKKIAAFLATSAPKSRAIYYRQATRRMTARFLKSYDPDFAAHDATILPDYPLLVPVNGLCGIEYMQKYLESLYSETQFLRLFSPLTVDTVLYANNRDYPEVPENVLRPVFLAALGASMMGRDVFSLDGGADVAGISFVFEGKSKAETEEILQKATDSLLSRLHAGSPSLQRYLYAALPDIAAEISAATENGTLSRVFLSPLKRDRAERSLFRFGVRMDDDLYSSVVYALEHAQSFDEQYAIVKEKVHSMYDLEDVLTEIPFSEREIRQILSTLRENEWAFLAKKHPEPDGDYSEKDGEKHLRRVLWNAIREKSASEQERILDITLLISDDVFEL